MMMQGKKIDGGVVGVVRDGVGCCPNTCVCDHFVGVGMMELGFVCCW